jgi:hypothetical protein
MKKFNKILA